MSLEAMIQALTEQYDSDRSMGIGFNPETLCRAVLAVQRQPLTEEEIKGVIRAGQYDSMEEFARAIPDALRLADSAHLGYRVGWQREAAAELRRLHGENERLTAALINICAKCRGNEWGPDTPRKEILAWFHDYAAKEME